MIAQGLTDAQHDLVVQSLRGSTLVELLRASTEANDLRTLHAMERNGCLDQAFLTPDHAHAQTDWRRLGVVMDGSITPMLDALGQVLATEEGELDTSFKVPVRTKKDWRIDADVAAWLARHVDRNLTDLEKNLTTGAILQPGSMHGPLRVRQHLCALGCLAVAADQPALVARINRLDPQALFTRMHSNLIERDIGPHAISPWGLAMRLKRSGIVIDQFDPRKIENAVAIDTHYDSEYEIKPIEMLTRRNDACPDADGLTMWLIRSVSNLPKQDWEKPSEWGMDDSQKSEPQKPPSADLVNRLCQAKGDWSPIAGLVMTQVPEFFKVNLKDCLESMAGSGNMDLLARALRECVDWKKLDRDLAEASDNKFGLKFIPFDHPLGIVTDAIPDQQPSRSHTLHSLVNVGQSKQGKSLDEAMVLVLQAMQESGTLGRVMGNGVSLNEDALCFAHEIAGKGLVKALGLLLQSGMDIDLKSKGGVRLIEHCEKTNPQGPALPMLRAFQAAKCVDDLLANQKQSSCALGN
jgi:hypothetical protein